MTHKEASPFTPGSPVPVELFVGRAKQIQEFVQYFDQVATGKYQNVFLEGERGIGKSSLASFLRYLVISRKNFFGVHVFLGRVSTLQEMVRHIFDQLLKEANSKPWFDKVASLFGDYVRQIGLFGISVSFSPPESDLENLVRRFPEALNNLVKKIGSHKKGLFIALDDINGLAEREEFANWYKSCADEIATHYKKFPVVMMPIGLPEKRDRLSVLQPSLMRIFRVAEIKKLDNTAVESFLSQAFESVGVLVEPKAMNLMVKYSSGLPILMHEIGDATFWYDKDESIDEEDAVSGVIAAAERIGKKYLDPKVYRAVRSARYRSILRKLAKRPLSRYFTKHEVESVLSDREKKVFHNFLRRIRELGIIETNVEKGRGCYRFVNEMYPVYLYMQAKLREK